VTKEQATQNFMKRGWIEIQPKDRGNFYLVKNNMVRVPDKELPKITKKEIKALRYLAPEERELLLEAKNLFKGEILCTK
jgi:hypothetical protein